MSTLKRLLSYLLLSVKSFLRRFQIDLSVLQESSTLQKMEDAKPGRAVELHGLKVAAHLNGKKGHLVRFLKKERRWVVSLDGENQTINVKPDNLKRCRPNPEVSVHPVTGQYMVPKKTSIPVTAPSTNISVPKKISIPVTAPKTNISEGGAQTLHEAVLGAFYKLRKGGIIISCGNKYMLAVEFDGPLGDGGVDGQMVFVDKDPSALTVVRERGCQRATELGRNFLAGETIHYVDTTDESSFFHLLRRYKQCLSTQGYIDLKSGLKLYDVKIVKKL